VFTLQAPARWGESKLVAEAEFTASARDGRVRHPSFKGLW
jgi:hypothetical protein